MAGLSSFTPIEDLLYTYDTAGNRISFSREQPHAQLPPAVTAAYDAANQQVQFNTSSLTYDANGNLTSNGVRMYTWDARNRLIGITPLFSPPPPSGEGQGGGALASFSYDALGRRASKTINGTTTQYLYDGNDIMAEIQGGAFIATYLRSLNIDEPFIRTSLTGQEFYHLDALGSVVALTDASATLQTTYAYDPFGRTEQSLAPSTNPFQYTGRENDGPTGLYYYRARYYSPTLHRFLSEDPLTTPGAHAFLTPARVLTPLRAFLSFQVSQNQVLFNRHVYVGNNPLRFVDPYGLKEVTTGDLIINVAAKTVPLIILGVGVATANPALAVIGATLEVGVLGYSGYQQLQQGLQNIQQYQERKLP